MASPESNELSDTFFPLRSQSERQMVDYHVILPLKEYQLEVKKNQKCTNYRGKFQFIMAWTGLRHLISRSELYCLSLIFPQLSDILL